MIEVIASSEALFLFGGSGCVVIDPWENNAYISLSQALIPHFDRFGVHTFDQELENIVSRRRRHDVVPGFSQQILGVDRMQIESDDNRKDNCQFRLDIGFLFIVIKCGLRNVRSHGQVGYTQVFTLSVILKGFNPQRREIDDRIID